MTMLEARTSKGVIRYRDDGSGEALLFIHGIVVNGNLWRKVVPRLSGQFRCIVPDWPLGGHTEPLSPDADMSLPALADLVLEFMDTIGLERATLVGNDGGGAIAQWVAVKSPARVERLVLNSSEVYDRFLPPIFKPMEKLARIPGALYVTAQFFRLGFTHRLPMAFGWSIRNGLPERAVRDSYLRPGREIPGVRRDLRRFLLAVDPRHTLEAAERLRSFEKPVLLAWATEDKLFPVKYARRLAAELPRARLELIDDSYTFVPEDQPVRLAEAIERFVREPV